ncbi:MAG: NADH-quinone oxidoreductase subunit N, partial [Mycobacteriales bacterium]
MPTDILAPHLEYDLLSPLLVVFGAAVLGVLVEAFAPAARRRVIQIGVALAGLIGALVAVLLLAGTAQLAAEASIAVDG